jgi:hypothetical protein
MNKKIVLFTTLGKLSEEAKLHVNGSFTSWKEFGFDVIVFGEDFHKDLCEEFGFILDTEYQRSEFGLPLVRGLFEKALTYKGYDLYCYLNSDIIFNTNPKPYFNQIEFKNFMAVGQRLDVWDYPNISKSEIHNPGGIDYFFFTPEFRDWSDMPDFSIARGRFDHWLMGASLETGHPLVDLTEVFLPIHPEPIQRKTGDTATLYNNGNYKLAYQVFRNMTLFLEDKKHGQTDMTPFIMTQDGLVERVRIPKNEFGKQFSYDIRI